MDPRDNRAETMTYDLVLMAGQSNMSRYTVSAKEVPRRWHAPIPNCEIWVNGTVRAIADGGGLSKQVVWARIILCQILDRCHRAALEDRQDCAPGHLAGRALEGPRSRRAAL